MSKNPEKKQSDQSNNKQSKDCSKNETVETLNKTSSNQNKQGGKPFRGKQDAFWYAKDQKAIDDMASFPFLETVNEPFDATATASDGVPGLMVFDYVPTVGSDTPAGPIYTGGVDYRTRAAQAYYQYVTQGFTGGVDFEAPDLLMTAIAAESLIALMLEGPRAYGLTKYYLQFNSAYARQVVNQLGFDYDDLVKDLANFRSEYNIRVDEFNKSVAVPKSFFIGDRWEFISSYLFTDVDEAEYATAYAYAMSKAIKYDATKMSTGTSLQWITVRDTAERLTVDEYFSLIDSLMSALKDDDVRAIFGAVRRVYNDSDLKKLTILDKTYLTPVVRNDIVAAAIHNAHWTNCTPYAYAPSSLYSEGESADGNCLMFQTGSGQLVSLVGVYQGLGQTFDGQDQSDYLIDMYDRLVSPANILDVTVNIQGLSGKNFGTITIGTTNYTLKGMFCRTELLIGCRTQISSMYYNLKKAYASSEVLTAIGAIAAMSHLDSHPLLLMTGASSTANLKPVYYLGEIDKYTFIAANKIQKLQHKTLYNLLSMPVNSKSITR